MLDEGYVKLWRKTLYSGLMQHPNALSLFICLLTHVTYKPIKVGVPGGIRQLGPGQWISGRKKLAFECGQTEQQVRTSVELLKNAEIITTESTKHYTVFTLLNWHKYQVLDGDATNESTSAQPTPNQQVTTKQEGKKVRINLKPNTEPTAHPDFKACKDEFHQTLTTAGKSPEYEPRDFKALKGFLAGGKSLVEFRARLPNLTKNSFAAKLGFPLWHYCQNFREYSDDAIAAGHKSYARPNGPKTGFTGQGSISHEDPLAPSRPESPG